MSNKTKPKIARISKDDSAVQPVQPSLTTIDVGAFTQIIHLSDIHIRPLLRHDEYRDVFSSCTNMIKQQAGKAPSVIAITGDLFDHKTVFRPETFKMCRDFLKMLTQAAPVILIAGNHDMLEQNTTRLDSLTPVIDDIPGVHYLKNSGLYHSAKTNDCFVVSSLYDKQFIACPEDDSSSATNYICLYHGDLTGRGQSEAEDTMDLQSGTTRYRKKEDFNNFSAVLLGDIHEHQVMQNNVGGYMSYAGSLIQQNHGEPLTGHGFSVWKRNGTHWSAPVHYDVHNNYGFIDIHCDNGKWTVDEPGLPKHCYARLLIRDCTQTQLDLIVSDIKRSVPEDGSIIITKKHAISVNRAEETADNTPDPDQTRKEDEMLLILEQAKEQSMDGPKLVALHKEYQAQVDRTVTMSTSVWRPVWVEFKNLFGYGGGAVNYIRFKRGLTSISAGNACGKSSSVNALLFGIFGRVPLNPSSASATYDVVNNRENGGYIKVLLNHGGVYYLIERVSCKPKGKATAADLQRLTKHDFTCEIWESNLNGDKLVNRCDTRHNNNDKFVLELFGDLQDFSLTNLLNKESSLDLLSMTPADQVKTLKSLFKMDVYDSYRDLNKKRQAELETTINKLRVRLQSFKELIDPAVSEERLQEVQTTIGLRESDLAEEEEQQTMMQEQCQELQSQLRYYDASSGLSLTESLEELQQELDALGLQEDPNMGKVTSTVIKVKINAALAKISEYEASLEQVDWDNMQSKEELQTILTDLEHELQTEQPGGPPKQNAATANKKLGAVQAKLESIDFTTEIPDIDTIKEQLEQLNSKLIAWALPLRKNMESKLDVSPVEKPTGDQPAEAGDMQSLKRRENEQKTLAVIKTPPASDDDNIQSLEARIVEGVSSNFTAANAVELKKKQTELATLEKELQALDQLIITDTDTVINQLCECPLIDEAGAAMYGLEGEYRLVEDPLLERLITHFENETDRQQVAPLMGKIAGLRLQIENLVSIKTNAELKAQIAWLEYERNQAEIASIKEWNTWLEYQKIQEELNAHKHNDTILEEMETWSQQQALAESRLTAADLLTQQEELIKVINYYDIQADIKAAQQNLELYELQRKLTILQAEADDFEEQYTRLQQWERFNYLSQAVEKYESYQKAESLKPELVRCQRELSAIKQRVAKQQQTLRSLQDEQARLLLKIEQQNKYHQEADEIAQDLVTKEQESKIYGDYNILMGSKGIASKLLFQKIKSIELYINSILSTFTKYTVAIIFDDKKQTMHIVAEDADTGRALSTTRFSGYEKLILQIAFKRALNKYSYNSKSSLIIIDEALDCIDGDNFQSKLPEVMNLITQDYSTCLAISQRDISHISDINMTIRREGGSSRLDLS